MKIAGSVALVTGANRGLGRAFAGELVARGAAKVHGGARRPAADAGPGITAVTLALSEDQNLIYPDVRAFWNSLLTGQT